MFFVQVEGPVGLTHGRRSLRLPFEVKARSLLRLRLGSSADLYARAVVRSDYSMLKDPCRSLRTSYPSAQAEKVTAKHIKLVFLNFIKV